ncbi:origin recognition complex subunit [Blumeria hordei DH14]|uniref:Origin recognition complex subunit n=1 Tax=Blumeria graminis f. sp. hordei (strain DH14) TaxID=546991 RepID=N1J922_BLUG1|nr:origin recognition complex subunit [Blumeria hordei DH14]
MSDHEMTNANSIDPLDYEVHNSISACYVYKPQHEDTCIAARPKKRRRITRVSNISGASEISDVPNFRPLLRGIENQQCCRLRSELFANSRDSYTIPTGFIVTGPNISSQEFLFNQISSRLRAHIKGSVVIIRSTDVSNIKSVLKQLIRDAISQGSEILDDNSSYNIENGRKLLNFDLQILHNFVKKHGSTAITIAFQDSEAFDTKIVGELVTLFSSWRNRIPFVLIFGIATSVGLFRERISRAATSQLYGTQFEVEQTSSLLERIFLRVVAGAKVPLRLGPDLISAILERQQDHVQSIQAFVAALKKEHFEAVRMLKSFRNFIEDKVCTNSSMEQLQKAQMLLTDDKILLDEIERSIMTKNLAVIHLLRIIHVLITVSPEAPPKTYIFQKAFRDGVEDLGLVQKLMSSLKRMSPSDLLDFINKIKDAVHGGAPELDLAGWADEENEIFMELTSIQEKISALEEASLGVGHRLKSSYAIHNKGLRTTVVAQRIQLSYEESTLTSEDKKYTALVDQLSQLLNSFFKIEKPEPEFLHEVWTFDSMQRFREAFTPRPRAALERALSTPSDYLNNFEKSSRGSSARPPATAILYQMYLESGALINTYDLWKVFSNAIIASSGQKLDERDTLVFFYQAIANLKMLGMLKQSKRKADHLAKLAWKGL